MAVSNDFKNRLLDWMLGTGNPTRPDTVHLALFTSDPTDAGGGTEVSGGSYARQEVAFDSSDSGTNPSSNIEFPEATANWGTISSIGLFTASEGGDFILWEGIDNKTVNSGEVFRIDAADFTLSVTGSA